MADLTGMDGVALATKGRSNITGERMVENFSAQTPAELGLASTAEKDAADAIAVAEAQRQDEERRLIGIWSLRFQDAGPSVNESSVIDARARELGIPKGSFTSSDGNAYGNAAGIDNQWAKRSEAQAQQVERELEAARTAALERAADKQIEWERNHAAEVRMEG